jgi:hypothetical protein
MIEEVLRVKCQVLSRASRAGSHPRPLTSNFTLQTFGGTPAAEGLSCQTKPIHPAVPGSVVQTNPISAAMPIRGSVFPGGQIVRNKAKLARAGVSGRRGIEQTNRAKQTQFADCGFTKACRLPPGLARPVVQTNPIGRSEMRETNPILGRARRDKAWRITAAEANRATSPRCPASGNKPNCPKRGIEAVSARATGRASALRERSYGRSNMGQALTKQSQFRRTGTAGPSPRPEALTMPPVTGGTRAKQSQFRAGWPSVRNKANFALGVRKWGAVRQAWVPAGGPSCETNPIWLVGGDPGRQNMQNEANSGRRRVVRGRRDGARVLYKQTQFPRPRPGRGLGNGDGPRPCRVFAGADVLAPGLPLS